MRLTFGSPRSGLWTAGVFASLLSLIADPAPLPETSGDTAWPQFRGPERNGISRETGLLQAWPAAGPSQVWQVKGIGRGFSSACIGGGRLFVTGDIDDALVITALAVGTGKRLWRQQNGAAWKGPYPGARSTCTLAGGRLFHLNAHGRLACLDPADGSELWTLNILERFDADQIRWGISECVLVSGGRVFVTPGGRKALMAALDAGTGKVVWTTPPLMFLRSQELGGRRVDPPRRDADRAGYASPVVVRVGARRLLAGASGRHVFLVDAETGSLVWKREVPVRWEVIGTMPVVVGDRICFMAPDKFGGLMVRARIHDGAVRVDELWSTEADNCHGGLVAVGGRLYGSGYRRFRGWFCLDGQTGRVLYRTNDLRKGSPIFADRRLYALAENGELALLEPTPERFVVRGRVRLPGNNGSDVWAHPALSDGHLYIRRHDTLWCFDVRAGTR
ncbi:MAG: PQQ-like beta-propeller repeat protein [Kiritimatiellaeota bacterium]|nr:PQQ-like beta-propeller repeat protein [Kiritimatiellota bacterium]